jgi:hypothetical protein
MLLAILSVAGWTAAPRMTAMPAAAAVSSAPSTSAESPKKSVLVLGWFFAKERELEYVKKMYKKSGYDEVVIEPSTFGVISKPRGWYRIMRRRLQPNRKTADSDGPYSSLSREFDVVHCLSGGFLALYVILSSGVDLRFSTLLCDSTPILPKPSAFSRFACAFLKSVGLSLPLKLLPMPEALLTRLVAMRWQIGITYIRLRHSLLQLLGRPQGEVLSTFQAGPVSWGLAGDYDRIARHALGTVYRACAGHAGFRSLELLYNPDDPFLDPDAVRYAASEAAACGVPVQETHVQADHIKALFVQPKTIFNVLSESEERGATEPSAANHERIAKLVAHGEA